MGWPVVCNGIVYWARRRELRKFGLEEEEREYLGRCESCSGRGREVGTPVKRRERFWCGINQGIFPYYL